MVGVLSWANRAGLVGDRGEWTVGDVVDGLVRRTGAALDVWAVGEPPADKCG